MKKNSLKNNLMSGDLCKIYFDINPNYMTYTETQLEAIKLFGRKDLEIWCKIFFKDSKQPFTYAWEIWVFVWNPDFEILWHEPHLENLFRVSAEKDYDVQVQWWFWRDWIEFIVKWKHEWFDYNATLPLLDQPNLSNIISLFR